MVSHVFKLSQQIISKFRELMVSFSLDIFVLYPILIYFTKTEIVSNRKKYHF